MPGTYRSNSLPHSRRSYAARRIQSKWRGRPRRATNIVSLIKRVSLKACETKRSTEFTEGQEMRHNSTHYVLNLCHTSQGIEQAAGMATNYSNRIGDEIIPKGMLCKFHYLTAPSRPNMTGVVYLFQYRSDLTVSDATFWRGQWGFGSQIPRLIDQPDSNNIKILKKYKLQNRTANSFLQADGTQTQRLTGSFFDFYYKFPGVKKMKYDAHGTTPKWKDLGLAMVFYDANNTLTSDDIGYMSWSTTFYFKDP